MPLVVVMVVPIKEVLVLEPATVAIAVGIVGALAAAGYLVTPTHGRLLILLGC
jgi:hypothetical protein